MGRKIDFDLKNGNKDKKKNLAKGLALGTVVGSALGAIGGLLFAPKSGKETRQQIKDDVVDAARKATGEVIDAGEKAASNIKGFAGKANEVITEKFKNRSVEPEYIDVSPATEEEPTEAEIDIENNIEEEI